MAVRVSTSDLFRRSRGRLRFNDSEQFVLCLHSIAVFDQEDQRVECFRHQGHGRPVADQEAHLLPQGESVELPARTGRDFEHDFGTGSYRLPRSRGRVIARGDGHATVIRLQLALLWSTTPSAFGFSRGVPTGLGINQRTLRVR